MRIGVKAGQWGWSFDELRASWIAAEDAGFDLISCFGHVTSAPEEAAAWDAPSVLTAMAGVTSRVALAVHVQPEIMRSIRVVCRLAIRCPT
jgi:alkanesulfonate monooxygenase SsuD/methylene tetrahydromethanopterin reductase-like flavin-dependent oxidoreductase (luciferase family)